MPPLCIQLCQSEYEEPFVDHSSKLCPKGFDFSVEGFRCRIGATVHKVVQYPLVMILAQFKNLGDFVKMLIFAAPLVWHWRVFC